MPVVPEKVFPFVNFSLDERHEFVRRNVPASIVAGFHVGWLSCAIMMSPCPQIEGWYAADAVDYINQIAPRFGFFPKIMETRGEQVYLKFERRKVDEDAEA